MIFKFAKKSLRKIFICSFLLVFVQNGLFANLFEYEQPFELNPVNDGILLGTGVALSGSALICNNILHLKENEYDSLKLNKSDIPVLDQVFMNPYSKPLHIVGTGTLILSMATPAIFAIMPGKEWLTIGTMYAETLLLANGIKEWLKFFVYRARPYMYFDDYPLDKVEDGDWNCSFPSGHTTIAFAGAAFTTMVFSQCYPDSGWKYGVAGISFGLAALTGGLRMASGNHFFTDVLVGAILGTTCGFLVPYMHTKGFYAKFEKKSGGVKAAITPTGLTISIKF
ncbi:MAG: phosphatase PAP2 family protein [Treponema sp.]|nr:phosphatase PAP2 family protein [Treponema sp.]